VTKLAFVGALLLLALWVGVFWIRRPRQQRSATSVGHRLYATCTVLGGLLLALSLSACGGNAVDTAQKGDGPGHYGFRPQAESSSASTTQVRSRGLPPASTGESRPGGLPSESTRGEPQAPPDPAVEVFTRAPRAPRIESEEEFLRQRRIIARSASLPHTEEAGCEKSVASKGRTLWGPRAPRSTAGVVGDRVVVNFEFDGWSSSSRVCRPDLVTIVVLAHDRSGRHHVTSQTVQVEKTRGSVAAPVPDLATGPPYYVRVRALGIDRRPSREAKIRLG